jgi:hypothetical protein
MSRREDNLIDGIVKRDKKPKALLAVGITIIVLLVAGLATGAVYLYQENQRLRDPAEVQKITDAENDEILQKVSNLMHLPKGEAVFATVTDKEALKDQPFFAEAENGDKLLIFSESSTAIIYRPSENKIVASGPVAISADSTSTTQSTVEPIDELIDESIE